MEKVSVCDMCGRISENGYNFCPWCGVPLADNKVFTTLVSDLCERLEGVRRSHTVSRIDRLDTQLDELDTDLTGLISLSHR